MANVQQPRFCRRCGAPLQEGELFCPVCGERTIPTPAANSQPTQGAGAPATQPSIAQVPGAQSFAPQAPAAQAPAAQPPIAPPPADQEPDAQTRLLAGTGDETTTRLQSSSVRVLDEQHAPQVKVPQDPSKGAPYRTTSTMPEQSAPFMPARRLPPLMRAAGWAAALLGWAAAALMLIAFGQSFVPAARELSVYPLGQAALGAALFGLPVLLLFALLQSIGFGFMRRSIARREIKPVHLTWMVVRGAVSLLFCAVGAVLAALLSSDAATPITEGLRAIAPVAAKAFQLFFERVWPTAQWTLLVVALSLVCALFVRWQATVAARAQAPVPSPARR